VGREIREMEKYKTWEITKALTENPNHEFKRVSDGMIFRTSKQIENGKEVARYISQITSSKGWADCVTLSDEWELIQQPIPFMEAVKAYSEGKTIRCEIKDLTYTYEPVEEVEVGNKLDGYMLAEVGNENEAVSTDEILNGKWYMGNRNE
jgi:hypothetical protein